MNDSSLTDSNSGSAGWEESYAVHQSEESLWGDQAIPILDSSIEILRRNLIETVVDVGCGDGRNLFGLRSAGFSCAGVDISPTALVRAASMLGARGRRAFFLEGSLTSMPFAAGTVEAITCFDVFGQVADPGCAVREFGRVLMPGGIIIMNAFATDDGTYGEGDKVGEHIFHYKGTTFRYFGEPELRDLFDIGWNVLKFERMEWDDPPHGEFRPYPHRHVNYFIVARSTPA